jgi:hypothetical protein
LCYLQLVVNNSWCLSCLLPANAAAAAAACCFYCCCYQAGTYEPLAENLPGPPDGVSTAPDGNFWVGLVSPIPPIAKLLRDPAVRALYVWLPSWLRPPLKAWGAVVKVRYGVLLRCHCGVYVSCKQDTGFLQGQGFLQFLGCLMSPIPPIAKLLRDPTVRALYVWLPSWLRPNSRLGALLRRWVC